MPESRNAELTAELTSPLPLLKLLSWISTLVGETSSPNSHSVPGTVVSPKRAVSLEFVQEQNGFLGITDLIRIKSKVYSWEELLFGVFFFLLSVIYFWCVRKPWGKINVICLKLRQAPVKFSLYSPNLKIKKTT